ncbi:MAG: hypothetical protein DBY04_00565 [Clostridiales bacterium]|nr:MAG: hypothetical protein DBY04_00565 [Clostridiales bacterium]
MKFSEFWKTYRSEMVKLLTTHFAIAVFSIMCNSIFLVTDYTQTMMFVSVAISVFIFIFYYYLVRSQMWNLGAKDNLKAKGGRMKLNSLTGLYLGLIASIPSFLINIVYIVTYIYRHYAGFSGVYDVFAVIELLWDAPAIGLYLAIGSPFVYLTASVLPALFAGLAYYLGTKEFSLFGHKKTKE